MLMPPDMKPNAAGLRRTVSGKAEGSGSGFASAGTARSKGGGHDTLCEA